MSVGRDRAGCSPRTNTADSVPLMLDDLKLKWNEACSWGSMLASPNNSEAAGFRAQ